MYVWPNLVHLDISYQINSEHDSQTVSVGCLFCLVIAHCKVTHLYYTTPKPGKNNERKNASVHNVNKGLPPNHAAG